MKKGSLIQFIKFGLVGVSNTIVNYLVYIFFVFIGVHYEMCIEAGGFEWLAQNTTSYPVGTKVSIGVTPENIQIMHKPQSEDEEAISLDD